MTTEKIGCDEKMRYELVSRILKNHRFLKRETIGQSHCGRNIDVFYLGNTAEQILFCGAFHGMESITSYILLMFLDELCAAAKTGGSLCEIRVDRFLKRRGLALIPCVNPDGVEIAARGALSCGRYRSLVEKVSGGNTQKWQANAAGVDINHNFDAQWQTLHLLEQSNGICSAAMTRYGGEFPESEPETRALTHFCKTHNIRHALAFHSQGEEIYSEFGKNTPPRSHLMANVLSQSSGYKIGSPEGLAVGGGFKDWFITCFSRPAFTVEVGKGENPLPLSDAEEIYSQIKEMLTLALII